MSDVVKSAHASGKHPDNQGGARPGAGRYGLHDRITAEELEAACLLIRSGRATLDAAIVSQRCTTHSSIYRSRDLGMTAIEKQEQGVQLSESEESALRFYTAISAALAAREVILSRQALGDERVKIGEHEDGSIHYASPKAAEQALKILQLTCRHWRPVTETHTEISGKLETTTPDAAALEARLAENAARLAELERELAGGGE